MRDYEEKSYYEIQLDNKQLILVFLAAVTVCVLIFVLGVMIGKGQKEAEFAAASRNQKNSVPSEADANEPAQALSDIAAEVREEASPATVQPKPVKEQKPTTVRDEPKKEAAKPAATPDKAKEKYAYEELDKTEDSPPAVKQVSEQQPAKTVPAASTEEAEPKASAKSRYTVQVMATSSKPKADEQISRLKLRGYKPFVDESKSGDAMVFKVRVGRFADTREAKEMASKIKSDLKLETWVAELD